MKDPNKKYSIKAFYLPTKRIRTIIQIGLDPDACCEKLKNEGYTEPFEVTEIFDFPSEAQMNYAIDLGISIPSDATKQDVSTLINFKLENDRIPKAGLIEFAVENGLYFSKYIGEDALMNYIFSSISNRPKIAFFIYCVQNSYIKGTIQNLNNSHSKMDYYAFADEYEGNDRFMKSMNRYNGPELRHFGEENLGDNMYTGGASKDTIAYKAALQFLKTKGLISEPTRKVADRGYKQSIVSKPAFSNPNNTKISKREEQETVTMQVGCAITAFVAILFFILWIIF